MFETGFETMLTTAILILANAMVGALPENAEAGQFIVVNLHASEVKASTFERLASLDARETSVRIGAAAIFSYLNEPHDALKARLKRFLSLSEAFNVPVVVQPDGEQWWGDRPDLWNWWDEDRPGYDPANRNNVEWIGWGPDYAVRIAWRNWGRQLRVLPPPNLMSPAYRTACEREMRRIIPVVLAWWEALPEARRDLLIGMKLGWESSIGVNAFYYPDGNRLLDEPPEEDPQYGLNHEQLPARGVVAMGYAAVATAGLANKGPLREQHKVEVVQRHLEILCKIAAELGAPRERVFTHGAGWKEGELLYDAARNDYACPGWSFYQHAHDPSKDPGVRRNLAASEAPFWAAVEWYPHGATTGLEWREAIEKTLNVPGCRYLCIYNWRGIAENDNALEALASFTR